MRLLDGGFEERLFNDRIVMPTSERELIIQQDELASHVQLENRFEADRVSFISAVDLAYWSEGKKDFAVCCFVTIDVNKYRIVEKQCMSEEIKYPYVSGCLSLRELPLILKTYGLLTIEPDVVFFDGNGILHNRRMGIATHASFFIDKPTVGIAKTYLKVNQTDFEMPENIEGAFTDIVVDGVCLGRSLRTRKDVKPIFVSCGNWIDIDTAVMFVLKLVTQESRLPLPNRLADIETKLARKKCCHTYPFVRKIVSAGQ